MQLKPHQVRSLQRIGEMRGNKRSDGLGRSILAVAPPGAGKSRVMMDMAADEVSRGGRVVLLVHRRMLLDQLATGFSEAGIHAGLVSPEYPPDSSAEVQIVSAQTLFSRAVRKSRLEMPEATLVEVDEAHQQAGAMARSILFGSVSEGMVQEGYLHRGADVVGFTATPLMKSRIYHDMLDFATYSELRREKMHQLVATYGPDEIDTKGLQPNASGDFSERDLDKRVEVIFGSVYREWKRLNPYALPALLFAPSVASAKWFAYQFSKKGVPVAHMDADVVLLPNERGNLEIHPSDRDTRDHVLQLSKSGNIKIITNRFLLREAIDMPWLYQAITATVMGSTTTALQTVGRLQRYWGDYGIKILQDHGGFYWRHGSPNQDRHWKLGMDNIQYHKERVERLFNQEEHEGIRCPKCGFWRTGGTVCLNPECKHAHSQSVRVVRSVSGRLKKMTGPVYVKPTQADQAQKIWSQTLFICGKSGKPVSSAVAIAAAKARNQGVEFDPKKLRFAPPEQSDSRWHLPVSRVYPWTVKRRKAKA